MAVSKKIYYLFSSLLDPFDQTTRHCIAEMAATVTAKCMAMANRKSWIIFYLPNEIPNSA